MKNYNYLAQNLRKYKELRKLTMKELSEELDIPKATLINIMNEGNTTLYTAIRISRALGISLDMLILDENFPDKLFIMDQMQMAGCWLSGLDPSKKAQMAELLAKMWIMLGSSKEDE